MLSIRVILGALTVLTTTVFLVSAGPQDGGAAAATRPAASARSEPLEDALRREIARALHAISQRSDWKAEDLRDALEIGPPLLPLIARHFREAEFGPVAVRLAGALPGVRIRDLVPAVSGAMRIDPAFRDAATATFLDLARRGDAEGLLEECSRPDVPPATGLALLAAVVQIVHPGSERAIATALLRSPDEQKLAVATLLERDAPGRDALGAALTSGRLSPDAALLVLGAMLPGARENEGRLLGRAILDHDGAVERARGLAVGSGARSGIAAELLAVAPSDDRLDLLSHVLGLEAARDRIDVVQAAFSVAGTTEQLQAIAHERGKAPERSAPELLAQASAAAILDVPDLLESLDLVGPSERAGVAAVAAAAGHPEGVAVLRRLASHLDPAVRCSVAAAIARSGARTASGILATLLRDEAQDVVAAAAEAVAKLELPIDPPTGIVALASLLGPESDFVLDAMLRQGPSDTVASLLADALDRFAVADVWAAAKSLMSLHAAEGPEGAAKFLGHREPLVRAAAVHAIGRPDAESRSRWVSVFERTSADPDPVVRASSATALGRIRDDLARARLVALARDPDWCVREAAIIGLAGQDKTHVMPIIRRAASDPDPFVSSAARVALVKQGSESVAPLLVPDLADPAVGSRAKATLLDLIGAKNLDDAELAAEIRRLVGVASRPQ